VKEAVEEIRKTPASGALAGKGKKKKFDIKDRLDRWKPNHPY